MQETVRIRAILAAGALALCAAAATPAQAQDRAVETINAIYSDIPANRRSDLVLLPALAKMTPPPAAVGSLDQAALLPAASSAFADAGAWAAAEPQAGALKALKAVTVGTTWSNVFGFGQPYGAEGVPPELIRARLYTEVGDPPTLAAAQHLYLPALDRLLILANVEATRLAAQGKSEQAIDVLSDGVLFCRQMCDRQMHREASWGWRGMIQLLERIRDVAYADARTGKNTLTADVLLPRMKRLDDAGVLDLERVTFPKGNRAAVDQVISRVYGAGDQVDKAVFASTMARLGASQHPLRLFSEEAQWRVAGEEQIDKRPIKALSDGVFEDWAGRWTLSMTEDRLSQVTAYSLMQRRQGQKFAAVLMSSTPDLSDLFELRQIARTEAVGTRAALAVQGYKTESKSFPPQISAIRPRWMRELEIDPFNPDRKNGKKPPLEYFVPQTKEAPGGSSQPYELDVVPFDNGPSFSVKLQSDTFVLYSVGGNKAKDFARRVQNTGASASGADYLLWPPVLSLYRQHLLDTGAMK